MNNLTSKIETTKEEANLLVVILDTNPGQKLLREKPQVLTKCVESMIGFGKTHLMLKAQNKLAVIACHSKQSEFIYPGRGQSLDSGQVEGQYEVFASVEKTITTNLGKLVSNDTGLVATESLLAGSVAMALCYIRRLQRTTPPGCKINSRILIITGSADSGFQYINYMNVFFAAQKLNVVIDACAIEQDLSLLQQGCDITGGLYLKIPQAESLLQYLLSVFLPEPSIRRKVVLPPPVKVNYRAACFCHKKMIEIGYVCSSCLSVHSHLHNLL